MIRLFKRRRPDYYAPESINPEDASIAYYWQLTQPQWHALTDHERAECRRTVTVAPRFGVGA